MKVLAINPGHNGSACLIDDGKVVFYIEEERLSRSKYDGNPFRGVLEAIKDHKLDYLVLGGTDPGQYPQLTWTGEEVFVGFVRKFQPDIKVINMSGNHHVGHAAGAFYNSGFDEALCFVVDGSGSIKGARKGTNNYTGFETESVYHMNYPGKTKLLYSSLALVEPVNEEAFEEDLTASIKVPIVKAYEAVTHYLGWHFIEAGKTMGLAPYGEDDLDMDVLFDEDGRVDLEKMWPNYPAGATVRVDTDDGEYLRGGNPGSNDWHRDASLVTDIAKNLAWRIQEETQTLVGDLIERWTEKTGITNIVISGGYGLNCVANYYLQKRFPDLNMFVDPISHDGGTALGLAKLVYHRDTKSQTPIPMDTLYLGPASSADYSLVESISDEKFVTEFADNKAVAQMLKDNKIVAMFNGRSEAGPRALGNRSILYNPTDPNGKDHVNTVKGREWFRPFAGSMLAEHFDQWFETAGLDETPFMMYAIEVKKDKQDQIPAITHVDGTCRIQTVTPQQNENYYDLISEFYKLTNVPIVFNTSFNLGGEPLVETVEDALRTLEHSQIDYLYFPELKKIISRNEVQSEKSEAA